MTTTQKAAQSKAWKAAEAEGLSYFWARTHVNPTTVAFVGQSWEDGGFHTDDDCNPTSDVRGNTVAAFGREELDPSNPSHIGQVEEWYGA